MFASNHFLVCAASCALLASNGGASTLTRNGTFDSDISQWDISGTCTTLGWEPFSDHTGGALSINCFIASTIDGITQCVAIPTTEIAMNFSTEVPNNGAAGPIAFGLRAFAAEDCSGKSTIFLDPTQTATVPTYDTVWTRFARANLTLPPSTHSVQVEIIVTSPADVSIDNIRLNSGMFQNDFESGG